MNAQLTSFISSLPVEVQLALGAYTEKNGLDPRTFGSADLALILLRLDTQASLEAFERLTSVTVKRCPAAMPPWPPKPVTKRQRGEPRVIRLSEHPPKGVYMAEHFAKIRVGMTKADMVNKGATARDVRYWISRGYIEMGGT